MTKTDQEILKIKELNSSLIVEVQSQARRISKLEKQVDKLMTFRFHVSEIVLGFKRLKDGLG